MKPERLGLNQGLKDISLRGKLGKLGARGDCGGKHLSRFKMD